MQNGIDGIDEMCYNKEKGGIKMENIIGQKFGRLTVVERKGNDKHRSIVWLCKCDCGNFIETTTNNLKSWNTKSCGCLKKELLSERSSKDLTGKRFGKLVAIKPTEKRNGRSVVWECECDCGNRFYTPAKFLLNGGSTSCGCVGITKMINGMKKECVEQTYLSLLNKKKSKSNTSGAKDVYWKKDKNKWDVRIGFQKKQIHIGYFKDFEDAVKARKRAEEQYFEPILNKYGKELL